MKRFENESEGNYFWILIPRMGFWIRREETKYIRIFPLFVLLLSSLHRLNSRRLGNFGPPITEHRDYWLSEAKVEIKTWQLVNYAYTCEETLIFALGWNFQWYLNDRMKRYDLHMIVWRIIKWRCISFSSHKESVAYISHKKCPSRIITHMFFAKSLKEKYLQFSILPVVKAILDIVLIFLSNSLDQVRFFGQASCKTS